MTAPHSCAEPTVSQKALWFAEAVHELGDRAPLIEIAARVADKAYEAGAAGHVRENPRIAEGDF